MKFYSILIVIFTIGFWKVGWSQTNHFSNLKIKFQYEGVEKFELQHTQPTKINFTTHTSFLNQTTPIPSSYNYEELGAFCKLEVQIEKKTRVPIKIRLGEVNLVEQKEGKPYTASPWTGVY